MGGYKVRYSRPDVARAAANLPSFQQTSPTSAYAAARFQEWQANADQREALLNARLQQAQSNAEMAGAQFKYNLWKDNELRAQTTHYYNAMPALQQTLKQYGIYPGSQRYAAEMAAFASTIPDALTHNDAIRKELSDFAKVDEGAARINQMMADQGISHQQAQMQTLSQDLASQNQRPSSFSTTAKGDLDVKATRPIDDLRNELPEKIVDRYSKLQGAIKLHQSQAATQLKSDMSKNIPNNPYAQQAQLDAAQTDAAILLNAYPKLGGLNPIQKKTAPVTTQGTATPSPTPAPSPTPDQTPVPAASGSPPALDDIFGQQQTP